MNINDFEAPQASGNLLEQIFNKQLELIEKYHDIEAKSGIFNYQDGSVPVNIHTLPGQVRLKDFAWRVMEEVAEAMEGHGIQHQKEEVADALHFLVEMYILAGFTHSDFASLNDAYEYVVGEDSTHKIDKYMAVSDFLFAIGNSMNKLKNKPWKQSQMLTDVHQFTVWIKLSFVNYVRLAYSFGITTAEELFDLYFRKSEVNKFRQRSGY